MVGTAGYLALDVMGTVVAILAWPAVLLMWRRLRWVSVVWRSPPVRASVTSVYADIDEVIDSLDDVARERSWDFAKRLAVARLVCENRTTAIAELEQRYDRGRQASLDASGSRDLAERGGGSR
jgi:hypothetical protein